MTDKTESGAAAPVQTPFNLFTDLKTSKNAEIDGTWVSPFGPEDHGYPTFKLARPGGANKAYNDALMEALMPHQQLIAKNKRKTDPAVTQLVQEINKQVFIEHCIKDWRNVNKPTGEQDDEGNDILESVEFSTENAFSLIEQVPEVFDALMGEAQDIQTFREQNISDEAGN